jgi:LPXTG-site transpeptidase (sortase) family protein
VLLAVTGFAVSTVFFPKTSNVLGAADVKSVAYQTPSSAESDTEPQLSTPSRMIMPSVDLALNILDSTVQPTTNEWPLSDTDAQFANFTPKLGSQKGTMLLYGHNTVQVMRKTSDMKVGSELIIVDDHGKSLQFTMTQEKIIKPEDVGFIYEDVPFRIVIFTCNGWNDEYRRLMFFSPKSHS